VGHLDRVFVGIGGGGLVSGTGLVAKHYNPDCKVYAVEPDAAHDAAESMRRDEIVSIPNQQTIADGANTPKIGQLTLRMMQ